MNVAKGGDLVDEVKDRDKVFARSCEMQYKTLSNKGNREMLSSNRRYVLVIAFVVTLVMVFRMGEAQNAGTYSPDLLAMQGRWVRSDAPYVIELKQDRSTVLNASYFNPRPIHVEKTETARKDGRQFVMIQLQDVNYQGSVYLLYYNREQDALNGVYIHGASGQRFQVEFSRQNAP